MFNFINLMIIIFGSINWFCIGVFQFDLVAGIFGFQATFFSRFVYTIIGLCGIWFLIYTLIKRGQLSLLPPKKIKEKEKKIKEIKKEQKLDKIIAKEEKRKRKRKKQLQEDTSINQLNEDNINTVDTKKSIDQNLQKLKDIELQKTIDNAQSLATINSMDDDINDIIFATKNKFANDNKNSTQNDNAQSNNKKHTNTQNNTHNALKSPTIPHKTTTKAHKNEN